MPMENIKQRLSEVVHNWTYIGMITLFLFTVQPGPDGAQALTVETPKTTVQLKKETLEKYSTTVYKPSEMLTDGELKELLSAVGFEGKALKQAWAIAKSESNSRPMAYNGNRKTGDSSYGIFQINMLGQLGIDRKEKFDLKSNILLFDPVINAEITYHMTKGGLDWSSWSSLGGDRYKEFLTKFPN
jgi:Lysozyme like domain